MEKRKCIVNGEISNLHYLPSPLYNKALRIITHPLISFDFLLVTQLPAPGNEQSFQNIHDYDYGRDLINLTQMMPNTLTQPAVHKHSV